MASTGNFCRLMAVFLTGVVAGQTIWGLKAIIKNEQLVPFLKKQKSINSSVQDIISLKSIFTQEYLNKNYLVFKNLISAIKNLKEGEKKDLYKDVCGCVKGDDAIDLTVNDVVLSADELRGLSAREKNIFSGDSKKKRWYLHLLEKELQDIEISVDERNSILDAYLLLLPNDEKNIDDAAIKSFLCDLKRLQRIHIPLISLLLLCRDIFPEASNNNKKQEPFSYFSHPFAQAYIAKRFVGFYEKLGEKQRRFYDDERPVLDIEKIVVNGAKKGFRAQVLEFFPELVFTKKGEKHEYIYDKMDMYQIFFMSLWNINGTNPPHPQNEQAARRLIKKLSSHQIDRLFACACEKNQPYGFFKLLQELVSPQQKEKAGRVGLSYQDTAIYYFLEYAPFLSMITSIFAGGLCSIDKNSFFSNVPCCLAIGTTAYLMKKENEWNCYFGRDEKYRKSSLPFNVACFGAALFGGYVKSKLPKNGIKEEASATGPLFVNKNLVTIFQNQK